MTSALSPVRFDAPLVNPAAGGLFGAVVWAEQVPEGGPLRWLSDGVEVRPMNFGGAESFGVWTAPWDAAHSDLDPETDVKAAGDRPDPLPPFLPMTSWAAAEAGNLLELSREDARTAAVQAHRFQEPLAVEAAFAARLLTDAPTPTEVADLVAAVGALEESFGGENMTGFIHARPRFAAVAAQANLLMRGGPAFTTPAGHRWVFGSGYPAVLGDVLVATSQPFGWRGPVTIREGIKPQFNQFHVIAERSLVIGYEHAVGAVEIVVPEAP